jgi:hypothetical protein
MQSGKRERAGSSNQRLERNEINQLARIRTKTKRPW